MRRLQAFFYKNFLEALSYKSAFVFDAAAAGFQILIFFFIAKLIPGQASSGFFENSEGYFPFVLVGIAFSLYQSTALQSFSGAITSERESGTLEIVLVTSSMPTLLTAGFTWNFFFTSFRVVLYFMAGLLLFRFSMPSVDFAAFIFCVLLTLGSLSGVGFFSAGYLLIHKRGDPASFFINGFSKFFSGVFFPVAVLPGWAQNLSSFLPLSHSLTAFRKVLLQGAGLAEILPQIGVLMCFSLVLLPAGFFYFKRAYARTLYEGTLGYR